MIKTNGMDHVVLFVSALDRAVRFYRDVLGMPVDQEESFGSFMRAGPGHRIGLFVKTLMEGWPEHPNPHDGRKIIGGRLRFNQDVMNIVHVQSYLKLPKIIKNVIVLLSVR